MLILKMSLILILASKSAEIFEKEQKVHKMLDLLLTELVYIFKLLKNISKHVYSLYDPNINFL